LIIMGLCFLPACVGAADAQMPYTPEEQAACTSDAFRLCSQAIPDASRVKLCLEAAHDQLSPPCAAMFEPGRDRRLDKPQ
jgi:hypothetical protein